MTEIPYFPPDPVLALRDWCRNRPDLTSYFAGRVYHRFPDGVVFPAMRVYQSGGGQRHLGSNTAEWLFFVAFDVWANGEADYKPMRRAIGRLQVLLDGLPCPQVIGTAPDRVTVNNIDVTNTLPSDDAPTGNPRSVIDCQVLCTYPPGTVG